jgi:hypothetical protein
MDPEHDIDLYDDFMALTVEGAGAADANGFAPVAGTDEPDPNWQPF